MLSIARKLFLANFIDVVYLFFFVHYQEFKSSHKPHSTIHPAGYKLIEDVSEHYCTEFAELAQGLGKLIDCIRAAFYSYLNNLRWMIAKIK